MVTADEVDAVGVAEFKADEERDGLDAEETAIDVVACINTLSAHHPHFLVFLFRSMSTYRKTDSWCQGISRLS